jgi:hypothetical protein
MEKTELTKVEQEMIDNILRKFDWESVKVASDALSWSNNNEVTSMGDLVKEGEYVLNRACIREVYGVSSGGFKAIRNIDDTGILLKLMFLVASCEEDSDDYDG